MKVTDFAKLLFKFLDEYLPTQRGTSELTIESYAQTLRLFSRYLDETTGDVDSVTMLSITRDTILLFLKTLGSQKKWKASTRNNRLAALKSFFHFSANENPKYRLRAQQIRNIPKAQESKEVPVYLSPAGLKLLFQQPNIMTAQGRRHFAILSLMYDAGARVSEIINLTPSSLRIINGRRKLKIIGKGNKAREIRLTKAEVEHLVVYMKERNLNDPKNESHPLFFNARGEKLTKEGISHILGIYAAMAREIDKSLIPEDLHPHSLRHTKAIHLIQNDWTILDVMRFLGHESPQTTMKYLQFDNSKKNQALQKRADKIMAGILPSRLPIPRTKKNIISFLTSKC